MASMDRYAEMEHARERARRDVRLDWLADASTWFAGAVVGMAVVFIGLAVDAYRHNHSASEETLLSFGNPGHLIAAVGLVLGSASALLGLTLSTLRGTSTAEHAIRRMVPVTAAWVALTTIAVGSITYIGASGATIGHSHGSTASATTDAHTHNDTTGGDAGVAQALNNQGITTTGGDGGGNQDPSQVPGALTQGTNGQPGNHHDHGKQPTFTQLETLSEDELMPMFPPGTMTEADFPKFKQQVEAVRQVALKYPTPELAKAAGYVNTTSDVPYMGQHYLNFDLVRKGVFDPEHPQGLLYSKIDGGEEKLVGVWFLILPGAGGNGVTRDTEPAGFAGNLDLWHAHTGLCLVGLSGASEGETKESCQAKGGNFTADLRWMMHVWVYPETTENPQGVFAYLNEDLFQKQQAARQQTSNPTGVTQ